MSEIFLFLPGFPKSMCLTQKFVPDRTIIQAGSLGDTFLWQFQLIICWNANHHLDHFLRYCHTLALEQTVHLEQHIALFCTAAHYSLTPNELDQILESKEYLADYLCMLVVAAKQILYSKVHKYYALVCRRLFFAKDVLTQISPQSMLIKIILMMIMWLCWCDYVPASGILPLVDIGKDRRYL